MTTFVVRVLSLEFVFLAASGGTIAADSTMVVPISGPTNLPGLCVCVRARVRACVCVCARVVLVVARWAGVCVHGVYLRAYVYALRYNKIAMHRATPPTHPPTG